jgi:rare lipoprotein A
MLLRSGVLVMLFASLLFASCAVRDSQKDITGPAALLTPVPGQAYVETGIASWAGKELHNIKTASGEVFDQEAVSAAHRTLPLGTMIRITNLDTQKSIKARVLDRGPFVKSRMLEVSYEAAWELGFVTHGTARVSIETVRDIEAAGKYSVQAALYTEEENAKFLKRRLSKKFELITITSFETNIAKYYSVRVGAYATVERAEQIAAKLASEGMEPVVLRKD